MKTVPKYMIAVLVKDKFNKYFARVNKLAAKEQTKYETMVQSGVKSLAAGLAGATLTNPADVVRNEMFKKTNNAGMLKTIFNLQRANRWKWMGRGIDKNLVAVAVPIATTIFLADFFSVM